MARRNDTRQLALFARLNPHPRPKLESSPVPARNAAERRLLEALGAALVPRPPDRIHGYTQAEIRMLMTPLPRITVWDQRRRRK